MNKVFYFNRLGVTDTGFYVVCTEEQADGIAEGLEFTFNGHYEAVSGEVKTDVDAVKAVYEHNDMQEEFEEQLEELKNYGERLWTPLARFVEQVYTSFEDFETWYESESDED